MSNTPTGCAASWPRRCALRDRVLLRNGDALDGLFNALDTKHVEVEVERKPTEIKIDKVAAIALSTDGVDKLKQKGVYVRLVLADGTRVSLASATSDANMLQGTTVFGAKVRVPLRAWCRSICSRDRQCICRT